MTTGPLPGVDDPRLAASPSREHVPSDPVGAWIATLDPGYFAVVMATGIVSIGSRLFGHILLADVLLVATIVAFVVLTLAYAMRAIRFPQRFASTLRAPSSAVSYFTVVAGTNVLATGLLAHGTWLLSLVLGSAAFLLWLALTYGLLGSIVLAGNHPTLREITGVWLVWVVGTQSVAVLATVLAPQLPWSIGQEMLGAAAVLFWGVGVVLYLILVVIIFLRLFLIETTPAEMGPAYWILMGATAISVRAAAGILDVGTSDPTPLLDAMRPFVSGFSVVLWSFGSWFIPMLIVFGLWRYFVRRFPWSYEPKLWSMVFPLGMYAAATGTLGQAIGFDFMNQLAAVWVWFGVAAWGLVVALLLGSAVMAVRRRSRDTP